MEKEKYGGAEKKNRKQKGNNSQDLSQKSDLEKAEDDLATKDRRKMRKNFFPKNITFWSDFTVKKVGESFYQPSKKIIMSGYDNGPIAFVGNDDEIAAHTLNTLSNVSLKKLKSLGVPVHENIVVQRYGGCTFYIPQGKIQRIVFIPKYRRIYGEITDYFNETPLKKTPVILEEPVLLGRYCDGVYLAE